MNSRSFQRCVMIHGAMGAGHGRCAVANRMESAPTHWVRLSEASSVSGGGLRKKFMGCHQFYTIPTASAVARLFHTAYDSAQCHSVTNQTRITANFLPN